MKQFFRMIWSKIFYLGHNFQFETDTCLTWSKRISSAISSRNTLYGTKISYWSEFFFLYEDNISCNLKRYPQSQVIFHILSDFLVHYRGRKQSHLQCDFIRICCAILSKILYMKLNFIIETHFIAWYDDNFLSEIWSICF